MWQMLRSLRNGVGRRFGEVAKHFRDMRRKLDRLAEDPHGLARDLSELRGELRGRLDGRFRTPSG